MLVQVEARSELAAMQSAEQDMRLRQRGEERRKSRLSINLLSILRSINHLMIIITSIIVSNHHHARDEITGKILARRLKNRNESCSVAVIDF
eukprot:6467196-Amphidinium_carterae.2